jgi:predicted PurR-regulated permease PerM
VKQSAADPLPTVAPPAVGRLPGATASRAETVDAAPAARRPGLTPISLFLTLLVAYVFSQIQFVLILVLTAIVFATLIERPVLFLERKRLPRGAGIIVVYATIIASLTLLFVALSPAIRTQAAAFRDEAPDQLRELQLAWSASGNPILDGPGQDLLGRAIELVENPERLPAFPQSAAIDLLTGVGGGVIGALTILVIAFYYLMEKSWLRRLILLELTPANRPRVSRIWDSVESKVGDWLRGQLLLCLIIGVTATIGYGLLGIRFWPLLGLWAGLTEIIPIVGPWLGGVPAVIIAMTQSFNQTLLVIGFIGLLQLLENTVLVPRVMRGAVGLTPLTVFVAILAGTQLLGIIGALLAIPVAAAVQVVLSDYLAARREARRSSATPQFGWRWMRGPAATPAQPESAHNGGAADSPPRDLGYTPATAAPSSDLEQGPADPPATGWSSELLARMAVADQDLAAIDPQPASVAQSPRSAVWSDGEDDPPRAEGQPN